MKKINLYTEVYPILIIIFIFFIAGCFSNKVDIRDNYVYESWMRSNELKVNDVEMIKSKHTVATEFYSKVGSDIHRLPVQVKLICSVDNDWYIILYDHSNIELSVIPSSVFDEPETVYTITDAIITLGTDAYDVKFKTINGYSPWPFITLNSDQIEKIKQNKKFTLSYKGELYLYVFENELNLMYEHSTVCPT